VSEIDDRIRQSLARQAGWVPERTDYDGLTDRISRRHRRRMQGVSVALVLALVAGPALGFLAGRRGGEAESDVATGSGGGVTVDNASGSLPTVSLDTAGSGTMLPSASGGPGSSGEPLDGLPYSGLGGPLGKAFVRDLDGTKIRVYRAAVDAPQSGPEWQDLPGWCFPNGYVQADVSTDDIVGIASGPLYSELPDGPIGGSLGAIGAAEGAPHWVVIAQAPADAARVRATFPDGQTDEMEPIDGVAVLIGRASLEPGDMAEYETTVPIEAFDELGGSLGTGTARYGGWIETGAECYPTPELPPPGEEQPADPAAARAEIEQLFGVKYADRTREEHLANIDDPSGMDEVFDALENGQFREQVLGSRTVLEDLVFLSATKAAVRYHTEIPNYANGGTGPKLGEVNLVDGRWKLSRGDVCRDVQLAGVNCS
jgi:hypothetical protein